MNTFAMCMNARPRNRRPIRRAARLAATAALLGFAAPAAAIPSPDLVINLSASVAQLLGLASVIFGGVAMRRKGRQGKRRRAGEGTPRLFFGIALLMLFGSLAVNMLQYTRALDARTDRLHTNLVRKSVENGESVGDTSLKTLSFSDQLSHPQGVETETLDEWLNNGVQVNLIDVREDEEFEQGAISGTRHVRYPDVLASSSTLWPEEQSSSVKTVLLCYSGNRSSELCEALTAEGKACHFMVGGYEKWLTEDRPVAEGAAVGSTEGELRNIADYPNKDVLLDTPDVHALVREEGAQFVDVRYPEDFVANHLPGAHNITMRALGSQALDTKIDALPDVPLIAACYDKRSCFYGTVIGLRLTREGLDFRGRYTVPHEYYIPKSTERAHVAAWRAGQEQLTFASFVVRPARQLVDALATRIDPAWLVLLALVALVRLSLAPLALKAERDTRVQRSLAHELKTIRDENDTHPRAATQATLELLQTHRIRPIAGMLNSLLQLGLTLLFYSAIEGAAKTWSGPFLWVESAAAPDPLLLLPLGVAVLFAAVMGLQIRPKSRRGRALLVLAGVALFAVATALGSAVNLYLCISMAALVLQSLIFLRIGSVRRWDSRGRQPAAVFEGTPRDTGLIPLAVAHRLPESTGRKASRLGELIEAGFDVPPGFVITEPLAAQLSSGSLEIDAGTDKAFARALLDRAGHARLESLWKELDSDQVAVRSSGANEDGAEASFAGVYESILKVDRAGLSTAARSVYESLDTQRSSGYARHSGQLADASTVRAANDEQRGGGGVLVQAMVPAEFAGVLFTQHPSTSGAMLVELVAGLGEQLVSGTVTPDTYRFGKLTGALQAENGGAVALVPPLDLQPLLALGREVEALFGAPQDIEWAYANGRFQLLQARDITRPVTAGDTLTALAERERARLLAELAGQRRQPRLRATDATDAPLLVQNELSELLPRPTPFSADLMRRLWEADGATDIACQELGVPYDVHARSVPFVTTVFGWTYVNRAEEARRVGKGPGAAASFRLSRDAESMQALFEEEFLPVFREQMIERNAIALDRLSLQTATALLGSWVERFVSDTYVQAERINIAAGFHLSSARDKLTAASLDPARYLAASGDSIAAQALALLSGQDVDRQAVEEFLLVFGHRAPLDYELSTPRFDEDPAMVQRYVHRSAGGGAHEGVAAIALDSDPALAKRRVLRMAVERARTFQTLKEDAKHYCLIELAQIRQLMLTIDRLAGLDGDIFQLGIEEACQLHDAERAVEHARLARARRQASKAWVGLQPPVSLSLDALERIDLLTGEMPGQRSRSDLSGARVAGASAITGTARVINDPAQIDTFVDGEILIARMTDPTWYPLFPRAAGIVTEVGGWLSHAAIVAREFDLPAIVGVEGACRRIRTGDVVTLTLDGNVIRQSDSEAPATVSAAAGADTERPHVRRHCTPPERRRAIKALENDRRRLPRFDANGEPAPERRAVARNANLSAYRKAA